MSNPYLSLMNLAASGTLVDTNQMMVFTNAGGASATVGYVDLVDFRDQYLLYTVNQQITALQAKPGNGAFASPVTMTLTGVVTGSVAFDGSTNFSLATTMPNNSIPIAAVVDLASTLATLQIEATQPDLLGSSYYSDFDAASQTSVLGYWDVNTTNTLSNDTTGTIFELASNGTLSPSSTNYINQLAFGSSGTLNWRRNIDNGGWNQVELWHSGNLTPSLYIQTDSVAELTSLGLTSGVNSTAAVLYQDVSNNNLSVRTGTSAAYNYFRFGNDGLFTISNGGLSVTGNIALPNADGLVWTGGVSLKSGTNGGSLALVGGSPTSNLLSLAPSSGGAVVYWDPVGNQVTTANLTLAGLAATNGSISGTLAVGTAVAAITGATLDLVTADGHLLIRSTGGITSIDSVNATNTASAALGFSGASYTFANGAPASFSGPVTAPTAAAGTNTTQVATTEFVQQALPASALPINAQTVTAYVLALTDAPVKNTSQGIVTMNSASANAVTVPPNSTVAFPVGTQIQIVQLGAGQTSVVAGSGVTILTPSSLTARAKNSTLLLTQIVINTWVFAGDMT